MKLIAFVSSFFLTSSLLVSTTTTQITEPAPNVATSTPPIVKQVQKPKVTVGPDVDTIASLVKEKSIEYGVDYAVAMTIIQNESRFYPDRVGDTHLICKAVNSPYYGQYMRSRGLVQINDCWHPEVTDAQAFDIMFSIEFLMIALKEGRCYEWSTCPL